MIQSVGDCVVPLSGRSLPAKLPRELRPGNYYEQQVVTGAQQALALRRPSSLQRFLVQQGAGSQTGSHAGAHGAGAAQGVQGAGAGQGVAQGAGAHGVAQGVGQQAFFLRTLMIRVTL